MRAHVFIKGTVSFTLESKHHVFEDRDISTFGTSGLPWGNLEATRHFGDTIELKIHIKDMNPPEMTIPALVSREMTLKNRFMGLMFNLNEAQRKQIAKAIKDHGYYPEEYPRKYPRIQSDRLINVFPLRVLVRTIQPKDSKTQPLSLIFDVRDLSPNGAMISSENQLALGIRPGHQVDLSFEPRGHFRLPIDIRGKIFRTMDELNPLTSNLVHSLGLKFVKIDDANKAFLLNLLKEILEAIKVSQQS